MDKNRQISLLGSTGSIGTQTLEILQNLGFHPAALTANTSIQKLEQQARQFRPQLVCVFDKTLYPVLRDNLTDTSVRVTAGEEGLCQAAALSCADVVVNAVVGMVGLRPTLSAIAAGKEVALANKETLVTGGRLVMQAAASKGVRILPIDSEHSAIFQSLQGSKREQMRKILLTASGGPFYGKTREQLRKVTVAQALNHPNWQMGKKITVDSATMMNKGLELIEAVRLFDCPPEKIEILIHRQSVLHSAVAFDDGAIIGQMGAADMRLPIQYALTYPDRLPLPGRALSLADCGALTFERPDEDTFVCLRACKQAILEGGLSPTLVNGANEQAVALFLEGKLSFLEIGEAVAKALELSPYGSDDNVDAIFAADRLAREAVLAFAHL